MRLAVVMVGGLFESENIKSEHLSIQIQTLI